MDFERDLQRATLVRRYKRFLADMELNGEVITAHCANPGAMTGLAEPGATCWIEGNDDPKRKLKWSWKLVDLPGGRAVVDTGMANRIVSEAFAQDRVQGLPAGAFRAEVKVGASRIDFVLGDDTLVEVKSVTLARDGWAEFPDSVTARGTKHLRELTEAVRAGRKAAMLYLLARDDVARMRIAGDIDPAYARAFDEARAAGVQMLCFGTTITQSSVTLAAPVSVDPDPQARS